MLLRLLLCCSNKIQFCSALLREKLQAKKACSRVFKWAIYYGNVCELFILLLWYLIYIIYKTVMQHVNVTSD